MPGLAFNTVAYNVKEYNAPSITVIVTTIPFTVIEVVGSDDTSVALVGVHIPEANLTFRSYVGSYARMRFITALLNPGIEVLGLEEVQFNIEGEENVSTKIAVGETKKSFIVTGEYKPTRSVKGGFDG